MNLHIMGELLKQDYNDNTNKIINILFSFLSKFLFIICDIDSSVNVSTVCASTPVSKI